MVGLFYSNGATEISSLLPSLELWSHFTVFLIVLLLYRVLIACYA